MVEASVTRGVSTSPPAGPGGNGRGAALVRRLVQVRRAGWNLVDQVLSALTNAVLAFVVARAVDAAGFGAFAVAFLVFSVLIGIERSLVGQPLSIRYSDASPQGMSEAVSRGTGTVVAITVPTGVVLVLVGLALDGVLGSTLAALGVVLPALILQDAVRMAFFAQSRAHLAALNDALWAVIQFAAVGVLVLGGRATPWALVLAWGGAAAVCVVLGLVQLRARPRVGAAVGWSREHRDLVGYLMADYLLGAGAFQGGILLVGGLVGIGNIGALRAAQVLAGPVGILASAIMSFGLPEISRRSHLSAAARWRVAVAVSALMFTVSLSYTLVLVLIPHDVGVALLGDTWTGAREVLLPVALSSVAASTCLGPAVVVFALGRARETFRLTMLEAPMVLSLMMIGARIDGAAGAAWGMCLDQALMIPLWFLQLRAILGRGGRHRART